MAITKIDDIDLYVGLTADVQACWDIKKFLVDNNIKFRTLMYADDSQHEDLFKSISTWWEGKTFDRFPILTYTEVLDDAPPSQFPRKFAITIAELQSGNFVQLAVKNT